MKEKEPPKGKTFEQLREELMKLFNLGKINRQAVDLTLKSKRDGGWNDHSDSYEDA